MIAMNMHGEATLNLNAAKDNTECCNANNFAFIYP